MARPISLAAVVFLLLAAACERRERGLRCPEITGRLPGEVAFRACTDGRERALSCPAVRGTATSELFCACTTNGKLGASFVLMSDTVDGSKDPARAIDIGHRRCGWEIEPPR
ncbi:MAG: hypothetical protein IPF92_11665 [Myxococcales bacterium]|jgi:hypothetical protein|nr:hypothetical protein [Myxococcales bacterium]MBL0198265.1 hypothetical protein [Myxococcales bacterium]HQY62160.1 hypothetical protein [Polyangiaceae bacterium]